MINICKIDNFSYICFQGWIIEHFPSLSVWSIADNHHESMPRCARYVSGVGHKEPPAYRLSLDNLQMSDVVFAPYDNHRPYRPLIDACFFFWMVKKRESACQTLTGTCASTV
jgi:hypothetical protein